MSNELKSLIVKFMGGKCVLCGYNKCMRAMHFHHLNPNEKDFNISKYKSTYNWTKVEIELEKCVLVCANCHAEIHEGLIDHELLVELAER